MRVGFNPLQWQNRIKRGRRLGSDSKLKPVLFLSAAKSSDWLFSQMISRFGLRLSRAHPVPQGVRVVLPTPSCSRLASSSAPQKRVSRSAQLKDEDIPHRLITLVDPESSSLLAPASLSDILIALDRTRFSILLVDPSHDPPICRILDKKAAYTKAQEKKEKDRVAAVTAAASPTPTLVGLNAGGPPKEVHLTWGVTAHDLSHKLAKAKELLGKGHRVTVIVNNKKDASPIAARAKAEVVKGVQDALAGVAKLRKPPGNKGEQVMMEFHPGVAAAT